MPAGVFFYPFRLAALASSPNRDAFCTAGKFAITAQSRPLGEGGCERSEQTEGVCTLSHKKLAFGRGKAVHCAKNKGFLLQNGDKRAIL